MGNRARLSRRRHFAAYQLGAARAPRSVDVSRNNIFDPEIREIGGEPLDGSGFEAEQPERRFESDESSAQEGFLQ